MSSTKRGGKRSDADNYPTPPWCIRRLLERCALLREGKGEWLEPAAGDGAIIKAVQEFRPDLLWTASELRGDCRGDLLQIPNVKHVECPQDFFTWKPDRKFEVTITNPPFRLAQEFLERSLEITTGMVVLLLRLNYLGSEKRNAFFRQRMPHWIYVLPDRPAFDERGTDSIEYAWFVFGVQNPPQRSILELLDLTPLSERRRPKAQKSRKGRKSREVIEV